MQLYIYATAITILAKGYLPISLITPLNLKEIMNEVRTTVRITNPDYDLVIKRLLLYYDMKLVTFGIDNDKNLIVQFPVFIQPYTQQPLILYQIENCTSYSQRSEYTGTILHTSAGRLTLHCSKFRNIL